MSAIACVGWGSLIWDPRTLPIRGSWFPDGPFLPIEFARTSSRAADKRVTLVVLPKAPTVRCLWTLLAVKDLDEAKEALADREELTGANRLRNIGFWGRDKKSEHVCVDEVGRWAQSKQLTGVVWTALEPNFMKEFDGASLEKVIEHLRGLSHAERKHAEEYIRRTPRQIDSECRRLIEKVFGWTPIE